MISFVQIFLTTVALFALVFGFYCQTRARSHISKEKLADITDTRLAARGVMPPKELLSEEGVKYHKGFCIGAGVFVVCVILTALISVASR
jgi:hypothetical protein